MQPNLLTPDESAVASSVLARTCETAAIDFTEQLARRFFTAVPNALQFGRECARGLPGGWNESWTSTAPDLDDFVMELLSVHSPSCTQQMRLLIAAWGGVHKPASDEGDVLVEAWRRLITLVIAGETLLSPVGRAA